MDKMYHPEHRENPSFKYILEELATDWNRIETGTIKCSRVFPTIGHLVSFSNQRLADMGSIESLSSHPGVQRGEKWHLKSVAGDPRLYDGWFQLQSHNQRRHPEVYATVNFQEAPVDPEVDRMKHHWLTALSNSYWYWDSQSAIREPKPVFNKKQICCDGSPDFWLYDYSPFDHAEVSAVHARKTKRMQRHWRRAVQLFLRRTFTTDLDKVPCMCVSAGCTASFAKAFCLECIRRAMTLCAQSYIQ